MRLTILIMLISFTCAAQWTKGTSESTRVAYVQGKAAMTDSDVYVAVTDNNKITFIGFGYFSKYYEGKQEIRICIEKGEVYTCTGGALYRLSDQALVANSFRDKEGNPISLSYIIGRMKQGSILRVRTFNGVEYNGSKLSLLGSTDAINYVNNKTKNV